MKICHVVPALVLLAALAPACSQPDPCAGTDGACLAVEVRANTAEQTASLTVSLSLAGAEPVTRSTAPPDGRQAGFPVSFPVLLGGFAGTVDVAVAALLTDGVRWQGRGQALVAAGEHARLIIDLAPDGAPGLPDLGPPDLSSPSDLTPPGPSARHGAAMAYHQTRGALLLFGGFGGAPGDPLDDTWEWNGARWLRLDTPQAPKGRAANMVYDSQRQAMFLFGGQTGARTSDTETWTLGAAGQWARLATLGTPPRARGEAALAHDPARGRIILYGGVSPELSLILQDTWELTFSDTTWRQLATQASPRVRTPSLVSVGSTIFLLGSDDNTTVRIWRLDPATPTWLALTPATGGAAPPAARTGAAVAYDPMLSAIVVSGGQSAAEPGKLLDEHHYFSLRDGRWYLIVGRVQPPARAGARLSYVPAHQGVLLYGGTDLGQAAPRPFSDTWLLTDGDTWRRLD